MLGVLQALIVADLTQGSGRFNLAQGLTGATSGVGAAVSTTVFGLLTEGEGRAVAFLAIALTGLAAVAVAWSFMPETRPPGLAAFTTKALDRRA